MFLDVSDRTRTGISRLISHWAYYYVKSVPSNSFFPTVKSSSYLGNLRMKMYLVIVWVIVETRQELFVQLSPANRHELGRGWENVFRIGAFMLSLYVRYMPSSMSLLLLLFCIGRGHAIHHVIGRRRDTSFYIRRLGNWQYLCAYKYAQLLGKVYARYLSRIRKKNCARLAVCHKANLFFFVNKLYGS